ncbi:anticodon nuclease, partial [Glaesserella parasuis]|nr:anticodon nuclease [Glaesserella parasuis]
DEVPFFHHVSNLSELQKAVNNNQIYTYHFNIMRNILEKTSSFLGYNDFSDCLSGIDDEVLYARALNLLSHGNHSIYEPREMNEDNKELFKQIFEKFLAKYPFNLPNLTETQP